MLQGEFPHHVEFQSLIKKPDGGGGHVEEWRPILKFNGFLDTPTSRELFAAQQMNYPLDRNFYYPYRKDVEKGMRCIYRYDDETEMYEVIGRPQDQGGQHEKMKVPLKLIEHG